ncbi:dirigent protein 21-like [Punica granatum]|uniref:Dirigent protein n=2 Tax=Punica granatum TaxID=22663 RepID=A0A218X623_PUNGR|nr:dirigent protein 21-like [Punica granatum]OWM80384.1 hypothetical protein CDL15_Pgr019664 [Punica granatum]PKI52896.1 hypothetical protein CRG98_026727 [Punica granatum]
MERVVLALIVVATITALPLVQCTADDPMKVAHWFHAVLPLAKEKTTHLHFYLHDIVSGKNPTSIKIAQSPTSDKSPTLFGIVEMIDDVLTVGPDPNSKPVGRAQGIYGYAGKDSFSLLTNMNFVFTSKEYNGSTLSVLGNNPVLETYREMPITGGTGAFRLARGIVTSKTYSLNITSGDAIVEYSIMVLHY